MKSRHYSYAVQLAPLATGSRNRFPCSEQTLEGRGTESDDYQRIDERDLAKEEWFAGVNFIALGRAISRRPALDDVRDVDIFAFQTDSSNDLVEQLTRAPNKRPAGGIFFGAWTFADKNQLRPRVAFSKNNRSAVLVKFAALAVAEVLSNGLERDIAGARDCEGNALRRRVDSWADNLAEERWLFSGGCQL